MCVQTVTTGKYKGNDAENLQVKKENRGVNPVVGKVFILRIFYLCLHLSSFGSAKISVENNTSAFVFNNF
jgi:hypothetical protein